MHRRWCNIVMVIVMPCSLIVEYAALRLTIESIYSLPLLEFAPFCLGLRCRKNYTFVARGPCSSEAMGPSPPGPLAKWVLRMVRAKNYETMSTFVKVMQKKPWPLAREKFTPLIFKGGVPLIPTSKLELSSGIVSSRLCISAYRFISGFLKTFYLCIVLFYRGCIHRVRAIYYKYDRISNQIRSRSYFLLGGFLNTRIL